MQVVRATLPELAALALLSPLLGVDSPLAGDSAIEALPADIHPLAGAMEQRSIAGANGLPGRQLPAYGTTPGGPDGADPSLSG